MNSIDTGTHKKGFSMLQETWLPSLDERTSKIFQETVKEVHPVHGVLVCTRNGGSNRNDSGISSAIRGPTGNNRN